jgi:hypothetical protein
VCQSVSARLRLVGGGHLEPDAALGLDLLQVWAAIGGIQEWDAEVFPRASRRLHTLDKLDPSSVTLRLLRQRSRHIPALALRLNYATQVVPRKSA